MRFARFSIHDETHPLQKAFRISRGTKDFVHVVIFTITNENGVTGVGECVPYMRYGESIEQTKKILQQIPEQLGENFDQQTLKQHYPAGAFRNAVDCALWDIQAKQADRPAWKLANLPPTETVLGACSLSIEAPDQLGKTASSRRNFPLLKIKLGSKQVIKSVEKVREACPDNRIFVDANEAWTPQMLAEYLPKLIDLDVEMIEQPLHASEDEALEEFRGEIPFCADESFHNGEDIERLANRYDVFNIKLDKTGGLTEAIDIAKRIKSFGKKIMIGSMMSTSYSLAPAMLLAHNASYVDLDSQLWLKQDRKGGVKFEDGILHPASPSLWG